MKVRKTAAAIATSMGLVVGFAALAGATPVSTINTTGPDSINKIKNTVWVDMQVRNHNNLSVHNSNTQNAWSGDAVVNDNTTGGDARTGSAMNHNSFSASATVNNSGSTAGLGSLSHVLNSNATSSISNTGPDSYNSVTNKTNVKVNVNNTNDLNVTNTNCQTATSGNASVTHNTTGGDAVSGNASNTTSSNVTFNVTN